MRTTSLQRTDHLTPIDFTVELIHFEPPRSGHLSTPYERTLMSPRLTLANTKLPPKTDSETTIVLHIMRTLVDRFRKNVRRRRWIQKTGHNLALLLIVLAFLTMVQQRRGPKMRPRRVQRAQHTLPRSPEVYRMPITLYEGARARERTIFECTQLHNVMQCTHIVQSVQHCMLEEGPTGPKRCITL